MSGRGRVSNEKLMDLAERHPDGWVRILAEAVLTQRAGNGNFSTAHLEGCLERLQIPQGPILARAIEEL